jgi:recombination protein RecR
MQIARPLANLIEAFERLPGIGPKTAQRLAYYMLHVPQEHLDQFSNALLNLKKKTVLCSICLDVAETNPCRICQDSNRDRSVVCVVEQPLDVVAIERSGAYKGVYHVLHGSISPLNNIGPDEIHISELVGRIKNVPDDTREIKEIIFALNPNMEGEATAMYISAEIKKLGVAEDVRITRLARGLPVGADIEYADDITLTRAMEGRMDY